MKKEMVNQIFRVPNTPQGRLFIELVKQYKAPCYEVVCKGRTINRSKAKRAGETKSDIRWRQDKGSIPMKLADNIGVYLTTKIGRIGARQEEYHRETREQNYKLRHEVDVLRRHEANVTRNDAINMAISILQAKKEG